MIAGLLHSLRAARDFQPQRFLRLTLGEQGIGWVRRAEAECLRAWPGAFGFSEEEISLKPLAEQGLTSVLEEVARSLQRDGAVRGWRGETYAVRVVEGGEPLFHIERAAMRFFGLRFAAAHLNGHAGEGADARILVARRATSKSIDPGMLDNLVAGGILSGEQAWQALLRECDEEAGIPAALAKAARPAGALRVCREVPEGLNDEVLHIHDLELPRDFTPRNTDGEVSEFLSLDAAALLGRVAHGEMTVEAGLVAVDFALRHRLMRDESGEIGALVGACRDATSA